MIEDLKKRLNQGKLCTQAPRKLKLNKRRWRMLRALKCEVLEVK